MFGDQGVPLSPGVSERPRRQQQCANDSEWPFTGIRTAATGPIDNYACWLLREAGAAGWEVRARCDGHEGLDGCHWRQDCGMCWRDWGGEERREGGRRLESLEGVWQASHRGGDGAPYAGTDTPTNAGGCRRVKARQMQSLQTCILHILPCRLPCFCIFFRKHGLFVAMVRGGSWSRIVVELLYVPRCCLMLPGPPLS